MSKNKKNETKWFISINVIATVLFFLILFLVLFNSQTLQAVDNYVGDFFVIIRNNIGTQIFAFFSFLGSTISVVVVLLIFLLKKDRKTVGIPLTIVVLTSSVLGYVIKNIIQRVRPFNWFAGTTFFTQSFPTSFSFPSGHSLNATVLILGLTFLLIKKYKPKKETKTIIFTISAVLCLLIATSRLWLGVHYFSDVLAGLLLAIIILNNFVFFINNSSWFNSKKQNEYLYKKPKAKIKKSTPK